MRSIDLIIPLEAHFSIELPDEDVGSLVTVGDVVRQVQRQMGVL